MTGHTARVLGVPGGLMPPNDEDLEAIARKTADDVPVLRRRARAR